MAAWDDADTASDGEELLDWLWDLPERYDVGGDEDSEAGGALPGGRGLAAVRKYRRGPGPGFDDRATEAFDRDDPGIDDRDEYETMLAPIVATRRRRRSITAREFSTAAIVVVGLAISVLLGYEVFAQKGPSNSSKPSNLAVGAATTAPVTTAEAGLLPLVTIPGAAETTSSSAPTTSSSVAAGAGSTTSTTTRRCAVKMALMITRQTTSTSTATTTTTTTAPSTTTTAAATTTTTAPAPSTTWVPPTITTVPPATTIPSIPPTTACH